MRLPLLVPVLALAVAAMPVRADEIQLADGRTVEGEVLDLGNGESELTIVQGGMRATQRIPSSQIVKIVKGPGRQQQAYTWLQERKRALARDAGGGSSEGWWELATQAQERKESVFARECAAEVVQRDRHHAAARALLGQVRQNGVWMQVYEANVARGEVFHAGRWMPWSEREALREAEAKQAAELRAALAKAMREAQEREYQPPAETIIYVNQTPAWSYQGYCGYHGGGWLNLNAAGRYNNWAWRLHLGW